MNKLRLKAVAVEEVYGYVKALFGDNENTAEVEVARDVGDEVNADYTVTVTGY